MKLPEGGIAATRTKIKGAANAAKRAARLAARAGPASFLSKAWNFTKGGAGMIIPFLVLSQIEKYLSERGQGSGEEEMMKKQQQQQAMRGFFPQGYVDPNDMLSGGQDGGMPGGGMY